jgi:inorganic pyrophosphatase
VKLLGAVALIDEGETDWKVLAIDVDDPLAAEIDDVAGLEAKMPGQTWDQFYKIPILSQKHFG